MSAELSPPPAERECIEIDVAETFALSPGRRRSTLAFATPEALTPPVDPFHVFPDGATRLLLYALETNKRLWISGPSGSGKSSLVEQACARLNYGFFRINADSQLRRRDLVGGYVTRGRELAFQYGVLPMMMQRPVVLLIDEVDTLDPEAALVFLRLLEERGAFVVLEHEGEVIQPHPRFRIVATANTRGTGDDSGEYLGTQPQSRAFLDRFHLFTHLGFLEADAEGRILSRRYPDLSQEMAARLLEWARATREGYRQGRLSAAVSTRGLLHTVAVYRDMDDLAPAVRHCYLDRLGPLERDVAVELTQRDDAESTGEHLRWRHPADRRKAAAGAQRETPAAAGIV